MCIFVSARLQKNYMTMTIYLLQKESHPKASMAIPYHSNAEKQPLN